MLAIRKWVDLLEEVHIEAGQRSEVPLRKALVGAVIENPYAGTYSEDLSELVAPSGPLAEELVARCQRVLGEQAEGCGKAAVVGTLGEQEHGVACLTTPFGDAMRNQIGGETWVTSTTKVGSAGTSIDVPLAYKRALFVREHYDAATFSVPDAPRGNEIVVIAALANRGRLNHRVGGLAKSEVVGGGLR